jgi:hypothetical protein
MGAPIMSDPPLPAPRGAVVSGKAVAIFMVCVLLIAAAGASVWYFAVRTTGTAAAKTAEASTIHFAYPKNWKAVPLSSVKGIPADATAVIQRKDKKAVLVVIPSGKAPALNDASAASIGASLEKKYADYKFLSAKMIPLTVGKSLLFTYVRTKQGVLHTIMIIPVAPTSSYIVETASPPQSGAIGKEIGLILKSARVTSG